MIHGFTPIGRAIPSLKVGSIVKVDRFEVARCSSMYKITDLPFLIGFISLTIIDQAIMGAPKINLLSRLDCSTISNSLNRCLGIRHSTLKSLCLGRSSHSIASGFLRFWDSLNFKKDMEFVGITVLFLDEKVNSVIHGFTPVGRANHYMPSMKAGSIVKVDRFEVARCSSMYKITDHPFFIGFISLTIIDEVIMSAPEINLQSRLDCSKSPSDCEHKPRIPICGWAKSVMSRKCFSLPLQFVKPTSRRPSHSLWLPLLLGFPELQERQGVCGMVLFLDEKVNSVIHGFTTVRRANHYMLSLKAYSIVKVDRFEVAMCSSMYKITNHQFLIRFISLTIIDEVITGTSEINLQSILDCSKSPSDCEYKPRTPRCGWENPFCPGL
ncbi:hypothetical protein DY000_02039927 [Brassica cretica]|uniref:DUF223 domain-containing protein n=1 Tax=Brassica cretica TaxID=69181 RepID=A0ABQ7BGL9_BRACR|nr:hypothetical protein DY000_02039927 [Brassica cretica]